MERSGSTEQLIAEEKELGYTNGYSSGYDSASCSSDNESHKTTEKTDDIAFLDKVWNEEKEHATKEKMNYRNTSSLSSHLRYIMSMPELCDVTFLVGDRRICGVKAIMGARSRVIYNLILKKQRELDFQGKTKQTQSKGKSKKASQQTRHHLLIPVSKYQPDDFQKIVEYLHCGSVDISTNNIAGLLCGASQFELDDLVKACWDFIKHCKANGSLSLLIPAAKKYNHHSVGKTLISWISSSIQRTSTV